MIDVHTHILPFVDDGSGSEETSVAMLKDAVAAGADRIICTPHLRGRFNLPQSKVREIFENFKEKTAGCGAELFLGREIYITPQTEKLIADGEFNINGTPFILIEFNPVNPCDVVSSVFELSRAGFKPIVAHAERIKYIDIYGVAEIKNAGGYIQVNAQAIVEESRRLFGHKIKALFKEGLVDFVASDIHADRKNCLAAAYKLVKAKFGEKTADAVFTGNAEIMVQGRA